MNPLGMNPLGMNPLGMNPLGMNPLGMNPLGMNPLGMNPLGMNPLGMSPLGMSPLGMSPLGMSPLGMSPLGMNPLGMNPLGMNPLGMNPLQRAKSELLDVRERFKTRTTRRGRQNRNTQDQMPADVRGGTDTVAEQANKTTLKEKIRRTFSPKRGKLLLCSSPVIQACATCTDLKHLHNVETHFYCPQMFLSVQICRLGI